MPGGMAVPTEGKVIVDGKALGSEDEIAKAHDDNYAYLADRNSIHVWYQLSDEPAQHDSFSYIFSFVFAALR